MADDPRIAEAMQLGKAGHYEEARLLLDTVLREDKENCAALFGIGSLAFRQGHFHTATMYWSLLAQIDPAAYDVATWLERARARRDGGPAPTRPTTPAAPPAPETPKAPPVPLPIEMPPIEDLPPPPPPRSRRGAKADGSATPAIRLGVDEIEESPKPKVGIGGILFLVAALSFIGYAFYLFFIYREPTVDEKAMAGDARSALVHVLGLTGQYVTGTNPDATFGRVLLCFSKSDRDWFEENYHKDTSRLIKEAVLDPVSRARAAREVFFYAIACAMPNGKFVHTIQEKNVGPTRAEFHLIGTRYLPEGLGTIDLEFDVVMVKEGKYWKGKDFFGARKYVD